jgi:hypothetical protein
MRTLLRCLIAMSFFGLAHAQIERPLKSLRAGDELRSADVITVGPRGIQLPQVGWQLIALFRGENRIIAGTGTADVTGGVFAYIDGTRTLAIIYFSASESTMAADRWGGGGRECGSIPVRFHTTFGSNPTQPECNEIRLITASFLSSNVTGLWKDARQRLIELGAGWSSRQLESRYTRLIWGDSFNFSIYVNPRVFLPKGNKVLPEKNDDVPQSFIDWAKRQVEQLRLLSERKIRAFRLEDMPKIEMTSIADLPPSQVRPSKSDDASVSDISRFPCTTEACIGVFKRYLDRPWPRALVVAKGRAFSYWSGEDPLANAMDLCRRRAESPDTCRFYAVNNEIVWTPQ